MRARCHQDEKGQSIVELIASVSLLVTVVSGMGYLFKAEWDRGRCAYLVFEKTHAVAFGSQTSFGQSSVTIIDSADSVQGIATCRGTPEMVRIPKLEPETEATQ